MKKIITWIYENIIKDRVMLGYVIGLIFILVTLASLAARWIGLQ